MADIYIDLDATAPRPDLIEPAHRAAVVAALAAADYPLSVQPEPGLYTTGPYLDWRTPDTVEVHHWDDAHSPWRGLPATARAANAAVVQTYATILAAAGFPAAVQTDPDDGRTWVAVGPVPAPVPVVEHCPHCGVALFACKVVAGRVELASLADCNTGLVAVLWGTSLTTVQCLVSDTDFPDHVVYHSNAYGIQWGQPCRQSRPPSAAPEGR